MVGKRGHPRADRSVECGSLSVSHLASYICYILLHAVVGACYDASLVRLRAAALHFRESLAVQPITKRSRS